MTNKLDTSPNQADASADMQRERLRSKLSRAAEMLREQGPIGTFIHDVKEAMVSHRSNEDRETFVVGNDRAIDSYDVPRLHLLHSSTESTHSIRFTCPGKSTRAGHETVLGGSSRGNADDPVGKSRARPSLEFGSYRPRMGALRLGLDSTELESTRPGGGTALL